MSPPNQPGVRALHFRSDGAQAGSEVVRHIRHLQAGILVARYLTKVSPMKILTKSAAAFVLMSVSFPGVLAAYAQDALLPTEEAPSESPPAPPSELPSPSVEEQAAPAQSASAGQWVYTSQYGWLWMPYGQQYTYIPGDLQVFPEEYVYYPVYGWRWVVAPWVYGYGPAPYWGVWGPRYFAWYARPWYRVGGYWGWGGYRGWGYYRGWVGPRAWGARGWSGAPAYYRTGVGGPHAVHAFHPAPFRGGPGMFRGDRAVPFRGMSPAGFRGGRPAPFRNGFVARAPSGSHAFASGGGFVGRGGGGAHVSGGAHFSGGRHFAAGHGGGGGGRGGHR